MRETRLPRRVSMQETMHILVLLSSSLSSVANSKQSEHPKVTWPSLRHREHNARSERLVYWLYASEPDLTQADYLLQEKE